MLNGAGNMTSASSASLRLLTIGRSAGAPPAPAAPATPAPAAPVAPANAQAALEAVRADAQTIMASLVDQLKQLHTAVLPALNTLKSQIAALLQQPAATVPPAPAPAPKPPAANKPAGKPKPKPTKPKPPASAADFKSMLGISDKRLAKVLAIPSDSARKNLPVIAQAIKEAGIKDKNAIIGILATIKTEVGSFEPIHEYGGPSYWARYNGRSDLGNRPGTNDGVTYHGRGYIQLTGRANYGTYGKAIGVDLQKNPDKALDPKNAAAILIQYFKNRGLISEAAQGDWMAVRRGVNGGTNGWDRFISTVNKLKAAVK